MGKHRAAEKCGKASCCWRIIVWSVCVGKHRAAEGSLLFGVHEARHSAAEDSLLFGVFVSKHRAAEGSFLFAASVVSSHEWLSHILVIKWDNTIKHESCRLWINVLLASLLSQNTADVFCLLKTDFWFPFVHKNLCADCFNAVELSGAKGLSQAPVLAVKLLQIDSRMLPACLTHHHSAVVLVNVQF